jgi:hypothetical protein
LAADVERFLSGQSVEAHPPSTAYRVRKFVRRYRVSVTAALALLTVLVLGGMGTTTGWISSFQKQKWLEKAVTAERHWRQQAEAESAEGRWLLYIADMRLANEAWGPAGWSDWRGCSSATFPPAIKRIYAASSGSTSGDSGSASLIETLCCPPSLVAGLVGLRCLRMDRGW